MNSVPKQHPSSYADRLWEDVFFHPRRKSFRSVGVIVDVQAAVHMPGSLTVKPPKPVGHWAASLFTSFLSRLLMNDTRFESLICTSKR